MKPKPPVPSLTTGFRCQIYACASIQWHNSGFVPFVPGAVLPVAHFPLPAPVLCSLTQSSVMWNLPGFFVWSCFQQTSRPQGGRQRPVGSQAGAGGINVGCFTIRTHGVGVWRTTVSLWLQMRRVHATKTLVICCFFLISIPLHLAGLWSWDKSRLEQGLPPWVMVFVYHYRRETWEWFESSTQKPNAPNLPEVSFVCSYLYYPHSNSFIRSFHLERDKATDGPLALANNRLSKEKKVLSFFMT